MLPPFPTWPPPSGGYPNTISEDGPVLNTRYGSNQTSNINTSVPMPPFNAVRYPQSMGTAKNGQNQGPSYGLPPSTRPWEVGPIWMEPPGWVPPPPIIIPPPITVPTPPTGPQPIVPLSGYKLVFNEEFQEGSNFNTTLSEWGPIVPPIKWIMHTPYAGDFGDAAFGVGRTPPSSYPVSSDSNGLNIRCYYDSVWSKWQGGLLASVDQQGNGFSQALGYWESKIWCPPLDAGDPANTTGLWPAFWLDGVNGISGAPSAGGLASEIDIIEAYSVDYTKFHTNWHVWNGSTEVSGGGNAINADIDISHGWHVYSCLVNSDLTHFYFDGNEVYNVATPASATLPLYVMIDFALGGGWPSTGLNTSVTYHMLVAYIRCWAPPT